MMNDHITDDDLFSYVERVSGALRRTEMREHIAACPACRARCRSVRGFVAALRISYPDTVSEPVPDRLLASALALIPVSPDRFATTLPEPAAAPLLEGISCRVRTLIAKLLPLPAAPAFARGQSDTVRLLFSAEEAEIPLCAFLSEAGRGWTLVGRICEVPHSCEWSVALSCLNETVATTVVGSEEEFLFNGIAPGAYSMSLSAPAQDLRIDLPTFRLE